MKRWSFISSNFWLEVLRKITTADFFEMKLIRSGFFSSVIWFFLHDLPKDCYITATIYCKHNVYSTFCYILWKSYRRRLFSQRWWWRSLSYRNQSIDLLCKSLDWFLYNRDPVMKELNNVAGAWLDLIHTATVSC